MKHVIMPAKYDVIPGPFSLIGSSVHFQLTTIPLHFAPKYHWLLEVPNVAGAVLR